MKESVTGLSHLFELVRASFMRGLATSRVIHEGPITLNVLDVRLNPNYNVAALSDTVRSAVARLCQTGTTSQIDLVSESLDTVIAHPRIEPVGGVLGGVCRSYGGTFVGHPYASRHFLATELIGAAAVAFKYGAGTVDVIPELDLIEEIAWKAQQEYLKRFEDLHGWVAYFRGLRHPSRQQGADFGADATQL